ncbi:MAG: hypothetical protein WCD12_13035 [Candidatus Binatus sp.]|jgi:hypothetical protein|uniref:BufA2 family periplasmic bufferin-type metallophore n=1 Tax=Candidatus Binatus sp. TaxID=2811406 RepID=UPI003C7313C8
MKKTRVAGAMLATAVALAFTAGVVRAEDTSNGATQAAQIKCLGANACKGQSACKTATSSNDCRGKNSCKGKGYIITADAKSCEGKGGHIGKKAPMPGM